MSVPNPEAENVEGVPIDHEPTPPFENSGRVNGGLPPEQFSEGLNGLWVGGRDAALSPVTPDPDDWDDDDDHPTDPGVILMLGFDPSHPNSGTDEPAPAIGPYFAQSFEPQEE